MGNNCPAKEDSVEVVNFRYTPREPPDLWPKIRPVDLWIYERTGESRAPVTAVAFGQLENNVVVVAGTGDGVVMLLDVVTGDIVRSKQLHHMAVTAACASDEAVYTGCEGGHVWYLDANGSDQYFDIRDGIPGAADHDGYDAGYGVAELRCWNNTLVISCQNTTTVLIVEQGQLVWVSSNDPQLPFNYRRNTVNAAAFDVVQQGCCWIQCPHPTLAKVQLLEISQNNSTGEFASNVAVYTYTQQKTDAAGRTCADPNYDPGHICSKITFHEFEGCRMVFGKVGGNRSFSPIRKWVLDPLNMIAGLPSTPFECDLDSSISETASMKCFGRSLFVAGELMGGCGARQLCIHTGRTIRVA